MEVFCNNFVHKAQTNDPAQLLHLSGVLHGIHRVFPPPQVSGHNGKDPISKKKLESDEVQCAVRKEVLVWMVDGKTYCIELEQDKQSLIDVELHKIVSMTKGVPFKQIEKLIGEIRHAATAVPTGKKLMTTINKILQVKLQLVRWKYFPSAKQPFRDWINLLKESAREPATAKYLVMRDPEFLGWADVSEEGVGGGWLPGKMHWNQQFGAWNVQRNCGPG